MTMTTTAKPVLAYQRSSATGYSSDLSRRAGGWASERGVRFKGVKEDDDRSLAGIVEVLDTVRRRACDTVLVPSFDHLTPRFGLDPLAELRKRGADVIELGGYEPPVFVGPVEVTPAVERRVTENVAVRLTEGRRRAVLEQGRHVGPTPIGYRRGLDGSLVIEPTEAEVIREAFRLALTQPLSKIVKQLASFRTKRGKPLSAQSLNWILRNSVYTGRVTWGDLATKGSHQPIVAMIVFNKVGVALTKRLRRRGRAEA